MDIKKISQKIASVVENILQEELQNEVNDQMSEDYQSKIDAELEVFENGIDDDEPVIEMEEDDIDDQTNEFLNLRAKRQK
jgi:hypothetical protein